MKMCEKQAVYRCPECGLVIEVLNGGANPVCCGKTMQHMQENTTDGAKEKHVPVLEEFNGKVKVKVGSIAHPMTAEHYIMWIEISDGSTLYRRELAPGEIPEAVFDIPYSNSLSVREYCNLHGLWRK